MAPDGQTPDVESVELRVHGVSGTTPEALLDRQSVEQVAGDAIAGFYRPSLLEQRHDAAPDRHAVSQPDAPLLEGYNWGGLTSGSPSRALWLLLLPFTLINIAPRARPNLPVDDGRTRLIWSLSRLLALGLTLLLVLATTGIGIDLYGWQCLHSSACAEAKPRWAFDVLVGTWGAGERSGGVSLGVGLLVGAILPALVLGALWFLSQRTINRYESVEVMKMTDDGMVPVSGGPPDADTVLDADELSLSSPMMWRNQVPVRRIRATHMQCGFAVVIASLALTLRHTLGQLGTGAESGSGWWPIWAVRTSVALGIGVGVVVVGYGVIVLCLRSYVGWRESPGYQKTSYGIWTAEIVVGLALSVSLVFTDVVASAAVRAAGPHGRKSTINPLPDYDQVLLVLLTAMIALAVALAATVYLSLKDVAVQQPPDGSTHDPLSTGLGGRATAALAAFGVLLGAVYSGAIYSYAAAWLHSGSVKPSHAEVADALQDFQLPNAFGMAMITLVASLVLPVLAILVALLWFVGRRVIGLGRLLLVVIGLKGPLVPTYRSAVAIERDYGAFDPAADDEDARGRRRSVQTAYDVGALLERGPVMLAAVVVWGSALTLVAATLLVASDLFHVDWASERVEDLLDPIGTSATSASVQAWGAYVAVLTLLGLVALSAAAFRVPQTRRVVGIVWDVASFWPRTCHPLAAPCYAERTVPDLVTRLRYLRGAEHDRRVVLAGHSQGSVLSAAALLHLGGGEQEADAAVVHGIGLLTFGCVLRRLYARFFPVYFGVTVLSALEALLTVGSRPRWRNLWRYTDYLGGQVTQGPPQAVPVAAAPPVSGAPTVPPTRPPVVGDDGHTWEWHAPDPPCFERVAGDTTYSAPGRHSNFWRDPSGIYQLAVVSLDRQIGQDARPPDDPV
jgi:hypothetical protein